MDYADELTHGPLRFIFTVDEEVGLLGAAALDVSHLADATYMINVDGGYGGATISCAGGAYFDFSHAAEWVDVAEDTTAYALSYSGLLGGHSARRGRRQGQRPGCHGQRHPGSGPGRHRGQHCQL